jgi:Tfp pilus assembly protein PilZ
LTVAAVPTGMKAGVRISPRVVWITPVRAPPSVAWSVKEKPADMGVTS